MTDIPSAFRPILNFARFQCFLPIKSISANGKCTKSSLYYHIFIAVFFTLISYTAYLISCDIIFHSERELFGDIFFNCIYLCHLLVVFNICFTSHKFIRNGCKMLSRILGTFCNLQTTRQIKFLTLQRIKVFYGTCVTISLMNMLIGKGNKLAWQFQVLKCVYHLQTYTIEQIITTLNDYFHQSFNELRMDIFQTRTCHQSKIKVCTMNSFILNIAILSLQTINKPRQNQFCNL